TMPINPIHVGLMRTGRILVVSGSSNDPTVTTNTAAVYDPNTGVINVQTVPWDLFCNGLSWMPDGRALIAGGTLQYPVNGHGWSQEYNAPFTPELYPWLHLLPDGRIFMSGANTSSSIFNPATNSWQSGVATMNYSRDRIYGSSVLLPLSAADNWRARIMIMGG